MNSVRGEQTRKDVLQAAKQLFLTQGYGSTSMRDIAKAAGNLSVGSLYNHFTGKEVIFATLVNDLSPHPYLLALAEELRSDAAPDFIRHFLRKGVPLLLEHYEFVELAQIDMREFGGRTVSSIIEKYVPAFVVLFEKIRILPGMRIENPLIFLRLMVGTVLGFVFTSKFAPDYVRRQLTDEAWLNQLTEFILHGVVMPESDTDAKSKGVNDDHLNP